jgi:DNA-binding CsgD family transcriptional regulator
LAKKLREKNATYIEIARVLGISPQRVRQLIIHADRVAALPAWTRGLTIQTARILLGNGFSDKSKVHSVLQRGETINRVKAKRMEEIRQWLNNAIAR